MKKNIIFLLFFCFLLSADLYSAPSSERLWIYLNSTNLLNKNWAFTVMPGMRYEFSRSNGAEKEIFLYEFFAGPVYMLKKNNFTFKFPLWYYYMGFPVKEINDYFYCHNIEFLPIIEYKMLPWTLTSRTIFHNTLYSSVYGSSQLSNGYSLVLRQMIKAEYDVSAHVGIYMAVEPFWGIIEDADAPHNGAGFWSSGFKRNRIYMGCDYKLKSLLNISPCFVYEENYNNDGDIVEREYYMFITFTKIKKWF